MQECEIAQEYMWLGKCKHNAEGKIVLPLGAVIPRHITGAWLHDCIDEYHQLNPSQIVKAWRVLRHVRFTLNFHFNSFSSALLSRDLSSCDSSHDPFHSFTYHMITPTFLFSHDSLVSLMSHTVTLCVPTWVPMTLVIVCFTYYLWLTVIPYESLYCLLMTLLGIPVSMTCYYYTAHLFLDIAQ